MFEALIITLREGVEAALILAIAVAILRRRGHAAGVPALAAGAAVALAASVGVAVLASRLVYNEELAEGIAMLVGAVLVGTLVWWMWRSAPHFKQEIEAGLERATAGGAAGDGVKTAGVAGVFLFAFGMVFREGVETAVFLAASGFNSEGLGRWLGAGIGLALAACFGVLFVRGTVRVPLKPFFSLTSAVLILIAAQLLVGGLHELSEAQVLPSSRAEMAIVGPLIKNELLLFTLTVALAAGWLLLGPRLRAPNAAAAERSPEGRLARAAQQKERRWRQWTGAVGLAVVAVLTTAFVGQSRLPEKAPASPLTVENGIATLDVSGARDGHLHFYEAQTPAGPARFFVLQVGERLETCADACEICGDKGYFESGSSIVCRNCTAPIARATIGKTGGCNPIPMPSRVENGKLVVAEQDLEAVAKHREGK